MKRAGAALALLMIAGFLVACGTTTYDEAVEQWEAGRTSSPPPGTPPPDPPPPPPPPGGFAPNFSEIQANVFTPSCATAGCHSGGGAAAGLSLEAANSYAQLVGIESSQVAGTLRVMAGNPDNSYLIHKMEGNAAVGGIMPPGGMIPQAEVDVIRQWITDGAVDDGVVSSSPVRVTSLAPMSGANLVTPPTKIIVGFDRELDVSTVNANTFILEASGGDMSFEDGNEVQIPATSITVPAANPRSAVFDLSGIALTDDTYRVRLLGRGPSVILDLEANALSGATVGGPVSIGGTSGTDFQGIFTIAAPTGVERALE